MFDDVCRRTVTAHIENTMTRNSAGELTVDVGALLVEKCGLYIRGSHKGKLRGWAIIKVCTVGGWLKDGPGYMNGKVVLPGSILSIEIKDFNGKVYAAF